MHLEFSHVSLIEVPTATLGKLTGLAAKQSGYTLTGKPRRILPPPLLIPSEDSLSQPLGSLTRQNFDRRPVIYRILAFSAKFL